MLHEVPEPNAPPHQLVFMSDSDKRLGSTIERYFLDALYSWYMLHLMENYKNGCKQNLGLNLHTSQELTKMLQWAAYKYSVEDYNAQVEEINKRSVYAYHLLMSYDPKT